MVFLVLYDVHQQLHNQFTIEPQETINKSTITEFGNNYLRHTAKIVSFIILKYLIISQAMNEYHHIRIIA